MLNRRRFVRGLTLVELLVALAVGLVVLTGAGVLFIDNMRSQAATLKLTKLNQDMRAMMDVMTRDIRRAGFVSSDVDQNLPQLLGNIFFGVTTDIGVFNSNTCLVYAYNRNDGWDEATKVSTEVPSVVQDNERLGFRLSGTTLQMRQSGTTNADCANGSWQAMSEPEVEITTLTFALNTSTLNVSSMSTDTDADGCRDGDDAAPNTFSATCVIGTYGNNLCDAGEACNTCTRDGAPDPACLEVRSVNITMTGRLAADPTVTQTISHQVRIRNDKYLAAIP